MAEHQEKEFIFAFCLCGRREGGRREGAKQGDKCSSVQKLESLASEVSDGLKCGSTMPCPGASAALLLHRAALQPAFAFSPAAWRVL